MRRLPARLIVAGAAVLTGLSALALAGLWASTGQPWFRDAAGHLLAFDFVAFRAIGFAALRGDVAAAYDPDAFATMLLQVGVAPHGLGLRWLNPPHFAIALAPLALLPFDAAFLAFVLGTGILFAGAIRLAIPVLGWPAAAVIAFGSPAAYAVIVKGQNGFLTGALLGAGLVLLDRRPLLAGVCIGLLSIKPQFGLLLPLLLALGHRWHAMASATVTVLFCVAMSASVLGIESWSAFARSLGGTSEYFLRQGHWLHAMHSIYAVLAPNLGQTAAAVAHGAAVIVAMALVAPMWRAGAPPSLRNAATIGLAFLVSPYVFTHDAPMLVLGVAMLLCGRHAADLPAGAGALLVALVLSAPLPFLLNHGAPVSLLAAALVVSAALAARRAGDV